MRNEKSLVESQFRIGNLRILDFGMRNAEFLDIAIQYNIYAYDAYFLECALSLRSPLLTLDRQMKGIAQKIGIQVME